MRFATRAATITCERVPFVSSKRRAPPR
jgi:hypothetical protein